MTPLPLHRFIEPPNSFGRAYICNIRVVLHFAFCILYNYIVKLLNSSRDSTILAMAYKVYIRPILEYCSEVWSPYLLKLIDEIENIQRYFTRKIRGLSSFNYENRLFILGHLRCVASRETLKCVLRFFTDLLI